MLALDVASALSYMHSYKVVHRDVKSANIVVGPDYQAFVTDFGTARVIGKHDKRDREKLIGTTGTSPAFYLSEALPNLCLSFSRLARACHERQTDLSARMDGSRDVYRGEQGLHRES